jgi:hypothetical protein
VQGSALTLWDVQGAALAGRDKMDVPSGQPTLYWSRDIRCVDDSATVAWASSGLSLAVATADCLHVYDTAVRPPALVASIEDDHFVIPIRRSLAFLPRSNPPVLAYANSKGEIYLLHCPHAPRWSTLVHRQWTHGSYYTSAFVTAVMLTARRLADRQEDPDAVPPLPMEMWLEILGLLCAADMRRVGSGIL